MGLNIDLVNYRPSLNPLSPDSGQASRHEESLESRRTSISTV